LLGSSERAYVSASLPVSILATSEHSANQQPGCSVFVQHVGKVAAAIWQWCHCCALHVSCSEKSLVVLPANSDACINY